MPDFPPMRSQRTRDFERYDSKGDLTTRQPGAFVSKDTSGEVTQTYGKLGEVVADSAQKWSNAYDTIQKTGAKVAFESGMSDILSRAANDPDYNNSDKYFKEIEKLKGQSLKGFSSKFNETQTAMELGLQATNANVQIGNLYKKKAIEFGQVKAQQQLDMAIQNPTPDIEETVKGILAPQVQAGIFSEKQAYDLQKKYVRDGKYNAFLNDLNGDPTTAAEKLSKNEYGLSVKDLSKAKKFQGSTAKRVAEEMKMQQQQTVTDFSDKLINKKLSLEEIQGAVTSGAMDAEMASDFELAMAGPDEWKEAMVDSKGKPLQPTDTAAKFFIDPLLKLGDGNIDKRKEIVGSALRNYNDKKIDRDDLTFILRTANGQATDPKNPVWGYLKSAVDMLNDNLPTTKAGANIFDKFKSRWDFKEDPRYTMQAAAIDQYKEDHPDTASYQVGDTITRNGKSYEITGFDTDGMPRVSVK